MLAGFSRRFRYEKNTRLSQRLVYFRLFFSSDHRPHPVFITFCAVCTFHQKHLVLVLNAYNMKYKAIAKQKDHPLKFFDTMRLSPPLFRLCGTFFEFFCLHRVPSINISWYFATEWMLKNPKGSPFLQFSALWDFPKWLFFVLKIGVFSVDQHAISEFRFLRPFFRNYGLSNFFLSKPPRL